MAENKESSGNLLTQAVSCGDRSKVFSRFGQRPSYSFKERAIRYTLRSFSWITIGVTVSEGSTAGDVAGQYKVGILSVNGADTNAGTISNFNATPTVTYETAFNTPAFQ
jgi:hypothetical protein